MSTTFSQLVDKIVAETKRPDLLTSIASYLNQTIRELHFDPKSGNAIIYRDNMLEAQLTADVESGYYWDIPNPGLFHGIQAIRYDNVWDFEKQVYPSERTPGRALADQTIYYYRGGTRFIFAGYGGLNNLISIAYYEYPRGLKYFTAAAAPASFDDDAGWTYLDPQPATPAEELTQQLRVTNWLLFRWDTVIEEGLRAKLYKRLERDNAARTSYSLYTQLRNGLVTAESMVDALV